VPIAVIALGFSVMALSLANAEIIHAGISVPIVIGTGALGILVGGLWNPAT
jgi:hypothetical protein